MRWEGTADWSTGRLVDRAFLIPTLATTTARRSVPASLLPTASRCAAARDMTRHPLTRYTVTDTATDQATHRFALALPPRLHTNPLPSPQRATLRGHATMRSNSNSNSSPLAASRPLHACVRASRDLSRRLRADEDGERGMGKAWRGVAGKERGRAGKERGVAGKERGRDKGR